MKKTTAGFGPATAGTAFRHASRPCLRHAVCWLCLVWLALLPARAQPPASLRLAPGLRQGPVPVVRVQATHPVAFAGWLARHLPACRITGWRAGVATVSGLNRHRLQALLGCPQAAFVDVPSRTAREEMDLDGYDLTLNGIAAARSRFPDLTGRGMAVSIRERPFDTTDIDFRGRLLPLPPTAEAPGTHATLMASLAAGGGNTSATSRGVAWQARLATASFAELLPDDSRQLAAAGISVQNHSYGTGIEPYYGVEALAYDRECLRTPALLHVFSAGNAGTQTAATGVYKDIPGFGNLTGQFKLSKNTLCVGGLTADAQPVPLSSRGPAHDGRLKPELVAFGNGGTSEAAALVSGLALLVQQAYRQQHAGTLPPAALVKAVLLNSARDVGRPGPDFETGFGNADAPAALQTLCENRYFEADAGAGQHREFSVEVPPGVSRFQATLVWHDAPAAADAPAALVNDLDLTVTHAGTGRRWLPWVLNTHPHADSLRQPARRAPDHLNNAEQVWVDAPPAGRYVVRVAGHAVSGRQAFSVAYGWPDTALAWRWPVRGAAVPGAAETRLRWQDALPAPGRLDCRFAGDAAWRRVADVPAGSTWAGWVPPDTNARLQLRLVAGTRAWPSDTFAVYRPLPLAVGLACPAEALLQWKPVPGAAAYTVYRLGAEYMEPWRQTPDTLLLLDSVQKRQEHYSVAPVLAHGGGVPGPAINYTRQGVGCYVRSFLARRPVSDTARLDVGLGTARRLVSATLERQTAGGGYQAVRVLAPVPGLVFSFDDVPPAPGRTVYRLALRTLQNTVVYSDPLEVFVLPPGGLSVFPNPVAAGTDLAVVTGTEGAARLLLLDARGRLLLDADEAGAVKTLPMPALPAGLYVLRVQDAAGRWLVQKIVVL